MTDITGSEMAERKGRFENIFVEALLECTFEVEDVFLYVVIPLILVFGVVLLAVVIYHWMFDLNAVDLASRSDLLSIDPDKWFPRS